MILERIRQLYPELTKSQMRLADYIVSSYHDVAFMTASELAQNVDVNEATVIRFAQRLGYPGYPDLVEDVRTIVLQDLDASASTTGCQTKASLFSEALLQQSVLLRRVASQIPAEAIEKACNMVQSAEQVLVVSQGASFGHARLLANHLSMLGKPVFSPPIDSPTLYARIARANEGLLVLCLSSTTDCSMVAKVIKAANARGARTLCLALSPLAPCARYAELALACTLVDPDPATADSVLTAMMGAFVTCLQRCTTGTEASQEALREIREEILGNTTP